MGALPSGGVILVAGVLGRQRPGQDPLHENAPTTPRPRHALRVLEGGRGDRGDASVERATGREIGALGAVTVLGRGSGTPTPEEVAVRAGAGRGTVSRVIGKASGVRKSTRRAVRRAIGERVHVSASRRAHRPAAGGRPSP
ncbi:LacI family DNA-binding transcriptional regulator [Streptomyces sp. NPDC012825]|uniref:LacI family DNA-binding transcriptional regulator n=1 Tax=Streptomyces sp. NPDC012825 TaxID=3364851 RepID=UPI0036756CDE